MLKLAVIKKMVPVLLTASLWSIVWLSAGAQTGAPNPSTPKPGATLPVAAPPKKGAIVTLDSVSQETLARCVNQQIKAQGIIGSYIGDKTRYNFSMDNGSAVQVVGSFPDTGGARWALTARVVQEGTKYVLVETSKEPVSGGGAATNLKVDPLLVAGGALIVAALITFGVMTARSKAARQREQFEHQLEEERRRSEAARAEAERVRMSAGRLGTAGGPGGTVLAGGDGSVPPPRANTIISVGSVEATSGPQVGQKFPLQTGETRIGRAKDRNIAVLLDKDGEVSSYHGSIIVTMDGRMLYKDESTNGSVVDGRAVHHAQADLHSGSLLEIGGTALKVTLRLSPAAVASPPPSAAVPVVAAGEPQPLGARSAPTIALDTHQQPMPKAPAAPTMAGYGAELEIVEGPDAGRRFAITRPVTTLGREDQDILLSEDSVSRSHASLTIQGGKFILADKSSTHGTRVNGEPLGPDGRTLADGDQVSVGKGQTVLVFHQIGA